MTRLAIVFVLIMSVFGVAAVDAQAPQGCVNTITVWDNDTLWGIAQSNNVRVGELAEVNGLSPNAQLRIGDVLCLDGLVVAQPSLQGGGSPNLPPGGNSFGTGGATNNQAPTTAQAGQGGENAQTTTGAMAGATNQSTGGNAQTATAAQQQSTAINFIRGQGTTIPANWTTHNVVIGDTLFSIARQANVGVANIIQANNIVYPGLIYIGETLLIPPSGTGTPPTGGGLGTGGPNIHIPAPGTIPSIGLPATAAPGSSITVTGANYPGNVAVDLYFEKPSYGLRSEKVATVTTQPDGTFSTTLTLPTGTTFGGFNINRSTVSVSGYSAGGYWAMNYFLFVAPNEPPLTGGGSDPGSGNPPANVHVPAPGTIPTIGLPPTATQGATVTVTGSNYPGSAPVTLYLEKPAYGLKSDAIKTITTNADGTFSTTITLPTSTVVGGWDFNGSAVSVSGYSTGGYWAMNYFIFLKTTP